MERGISHHALHVSHATLGTVTYLYYLRHCYGTVLYTEAEAPRTRHCYHSVPREYSRVLGGTAMPRAQPSMMTH